MSLSRRSEKWVELTRADEYRTFYLQPSPHWGYKVHVHPSGHSEIVRSPMGILVGSRPTMAAAIQVAEHHAGEEARQRIHVARQDLTDSERALAWLTAEESR
jgi:hypothetical protein